MDYPCCLSVSQGPSLLILLVFAFALSDICNALDLSDFVRETIATSLRHPVACHVKLISPGRYFISINPKQLSASTSKSVNIQQD